MAQLLTFAGTSAIYEVEGAEVDVLITPSVTAYMKFWTSPDGVNWDVLVPGTVYTQPIEKTFTAPELGAFVKAEIYGGIGTVTLSASGRTVPPLVIDTQTTVSGTPYAGQTLTCSPAGVSGGTPPYDFNYVWQAYDNTWQNVAQGLEYTVPDGEQWIGKEIRAVTVCTDSSSDWDVDDRTVMSPSAPITIVPTPVPPIVITTDCSISGTLEVNQTLTAVAPVWTGGGDDSSAIGFFWSNYDTGGMLEVSDNYLVKPEDVGIRIQLSCTVAGTGESVSNSSTPTGVVPPQPTIGTLSTTVDGVAYTDPLNETKDTEVVLAVTYSGTSPANEVQYYWEKSGGGGNIVSGEYTNSCTFNTGMTFSTNRIVCTVTNPKASDTPQSSHAIQITTT